MGFDEIDEEKTFEIISPLEKLHSNEELLNIVIDGTELVLVVSD